MNDCGWLSDRMPLVALGRAEWSTDEARHLSGCRSCQEEWELVRVTSLLGQEAGAGLDAGATTSALLRRLGRTRQESRLRRQTWSFAALATAAGIAAAVWIGRPSDGPPAPATAVVAGGLQIPLPELDNLEPAELDTLLQTIDEPLVGGSTEAPAPGDPDDHDLEGVLDTWEG